MVSIHMHVRSKMMNRGASHTGLYPAVTVETVWTQPDPVTPGGGGGRLSSKSTGMCGHKMEGYGSFLGL